METLEFHTNVCCEYFYNNVTPILDKITLSHVLRLFCLQFTYF